MDKTHDVLDLDLSASSRGVWLVKVPKYLSDKWEKAEGTEVGRLLINKPKFPGGKPEVLFTESNRKTTEVDNTPKNHKFVLTGVASQSLSVLSQGPKQENIAIEGKVIQRAECRPVADANYMKLKRSTFEASNKPKREVKQLMSPVLNYKPVANHAFNIESDIKKKEQGKRARGEKDQVMDTLFNAFEKHQYYNVKDLVTITKQPVTFLKEILKEICNYNMKAPHRNMWELKPEYRHYKPHDNDTSS